MTLQNLPMMAGVWDDATGFTRDDSAWEYFDFVSSIDANIKPGDISRRLCSREATDAAFHFTWKVTYAAITGIRDPRPPKDGPMEQSPGITSTATSLSSQVKASTTGHIGVQARPQPLCIFACRSTRSKQFDPIQITGFTMSSGAYHRNPGTASRSTPAGSRSQTSLDVWRGDNFSRYTFNSLLVAICVTHRQCRHKPASPATRSRAANGGFAANLLGRHASAACSSPHRCS
jgi:hypothetical protein